MSDTWANLAGLTTKTYSDSWMRMARPPARTRHVETGRRRSSTGTARRLIAACGIALVGSALAATAWMTSAPWSSLERAVAGDQSTLGAEAPVESATTALVGRSEGPMAEALARSRPASRGDDFGGTDRAWPFVAVDPERQVEPPPLPGAPIAEANQFHVVGPGETLLGIAIDLGVDAERLVAANKLANRDALAVGQRLVVPAKDDAEARRRASNRGATLRPRFMWPLHGNVTTYFGELGGVWIGGRHTGLDIAAQEGQPLRAAEAGTVVDAGWAETRGLGNFILIDHGMGYRTLYAHLSEIRVKVGQDVLRGEHIGDAGNTGVSFGPHLHFELRVDGQTLDPLEYLP